MRTTSVAMADGADVLWRVRESRFVIEYESVSGEAKVVHGAWETLADARRFGFPLDHKITEVPTYHYAIGCGVVRWFDGKWMAVAGVRS